VQNKTNMQLKVSEEKDIKMQNQENGHVQKEQNVQHQVQEKIKVDQILQKEHQKEHQKDHNQKDYSEKARIFHKTELGKILEKN